MKTGRNVQVGIVPGHRHSVHTKPMVNPLVDYFSAKLPIASALKGTYAKTAAHLVPYFVAADGLASLK
jgi:hypothetical protein